MDGGEEKNDFTAFLRKYIFIGFSYVSHRRAANAQARLHKCAASPEHSLLVYRTYE